VPNLFDASGKPGLYQASRIVKNFGPVEVLRGVSLALRPSRVMTVMGENGAGKSTLFKVLAGQMRPTAGMLVLDGRDLVLASPHAAHASGIYLVPQEPMLMPELTVAETMFVGQLPTTGPLLQRVDWAEARRRSRAVLDTLELDIDVNQRAKSLSIAQQQQTECAKALLRGCRIILFDEPTSPLTSHEVDKLFVIMRRLQAEGYTLGFISHRMDEVMEISDDIAVLRDGRLVDTVERDGFDRLQLLSKMVGREMRAIPRRTTTNTTAEPILEVRDLASEPRFRGVSFTLHKGEVLGLAGLVGAGRTEIAETIFGVRIATTGQVSLAGEAVTHRSSHDLIRKGLVYVPEDRARHGAVLPMTIAQNVTAGLLERVRQTAGLLSTDHEMAISAKAVRDFKIRCAGLDQPLRELSGGNQQKTVFGKWITTEPQVVYEGRIVAELKGAAITSHAVGASYLAKGASGETRDEAGS
jgi:ABC-type sugar transport system ATPase subunit